jgi:hypothetical protein
MLETVRLPGQFQFIKYTRDSDGSYGETIAVQGAFSAQQLRRMATVMDAVRRENNDGVPAEWSTGDYVVVGKGRKTEGFKVMRVEPEAVWLCPYIYAHDVACEKRWIKYTPKEMKGWVKHTEREVD